jgi:hypothetical protein
MVSFALRNCILERLHFSRNSVWETQSWTSCIRRPNSRAYRESEEDRADSRREPGDIADRGVSHTVGSPQSAYSIRTRRKRSTPIWGLNYVKEIPAL